MTVDRIDNYEIMMVGYLKAVIWFFLKKKTEKEKRNSFYSVFER